MLGLLRSAEMMLLAAQPGRVEQGQLLGLQGPAGLGLVHGAAWSEGLAEGLSGLSVSRTQGKHEFFGLQKCIL